MNNNTQTVKKYFEQNLVEQFNESLPFNDEPVTDEGDAPREYAPMRVKHVPEHFQLVTDSQEVRAILDYFGIEDNYGCLFVEVLDGDYGTVFAVEHSIPYLEEPLVALDAFNKFQRVLQKA